MISSVAVSVASSEGGSKHLSSHQSSSQEPLIQSGNETRVGQSKLLTSHQSSSQEDGAVVQSESKETQEVRSKRIPSTGMPMLETANSSQGNGEGDEDEGAYATVDKEYDYVDKVASANEPDDDGGGEYATVGGAMDEGSVKPAEPPRENGDNKGEQEQEGRDRGPGLSYGKVTRHMVPISKKGSYSEVVTLESPILPPGRPRAVTEPIDPSQTDHQKMGMRDDRSLTESAAHLPLPQIPKLEVSEEMYDSIPEGLKESAAVPADSGGNTSPSAAAGAGAGVAKTKPIRESLYESVEEAKEEVKDEIEVDEDMYESVPEDIKQSAPTPSSPLILSPSSPLPPSPRSPSLNRVKSEVPVPTSPTLPKEDHDNGKRKTKDLTTAKDAKNEQKKHKALSKAKSDTGVESRARSLSALFHRRKPSPLASPKHKEKDQHEPLPRVPTEGSVASPSHLHPPSPPPMPAPPPPEEDEDEDYPSDSAYDMIDVINPRGAALLNRKDATAKDKSASLPSSMRTAGASVFHHVEHGPLPEVPEESAGGLVARERVTEVMDPEYDTVVLQQVQNEPSYDSVEVTHEVDAMPKLEPAEPIIVVAAEAEQENGQTPSNKYARVSSHTTTETVSTQDLSALTPEHDSLGYAIIPAHLKMKKRAQSDARKENAETALGEVTRPRNTEWDDPGYDKVTTSQAAEADTLTPPSPPMEPAYESVTDAMKEKQEAEAAGSAADVEVPYASVDMAAKRRSQMLRQMSGGAHTLDTNEAIAALHEKSPSPNPPPLPQQGDLGDLTEFVNPPIPNQDEAALELIGPGELQPPEPGKTVNPYSQIDVLVDPPYASVKTKPESEEPPKEVQSEATGEDENPYATVDNLTDATSSGSTNDPPYAKIKRGKVVGDDGSDGLSESVTTSGTAGSRVNGSHVDVGEDGEEDTYNRLDHGFGNAATCRVHTMASPEGENEYSTVTLDFSTSPVSQTRGNVNGVDIRHVEETTVDFAD